MLAVPYPRCCLHALPGLESRPECRLTKTRILCGKLRGVTEDGITDTDNCQLTLCGPLCAEPIATTESVTAEAVTTTITKPEKSGEQAVKHQHKTLQRGEEGWKTNKVPNEDE